MSDLAEKLANMSPERRRYTLNLPYHLSKGQEGKRLKQLLTSFDFLLAKVEDRGSQSLVEDYEFAFSPNVLADQAMRENLRLIQDAIRQSAHILDEDHTQLAGQLLGRLSQTPVEEKSWKKNLPLLKIQTKRKDIGLQNLLGQAKEWQGASWLCPINSSLVSQDKALLRSISGHADAVNSVAITSNGKFLLSASADGTVKVWDIASWRPLRTFTGHSGGVRWVTVTLDGQFALSASLDKTVKVWEIETGRELYTLEGHTCAVRQVAVTPDSKFAFSLSGGGGEVRQNGETCVWNLKEGQLVRTFGEYTDVAVTSNNRFAILAGMQGVSVWNIEKGQFVRFQPFDSCMSVATTPNSKFALCAGNKIINIRPLNIASSIYVCNLETNRRQQVVRTFKGHHKDNITAITVTPNGQFVLSAAVDGIKIWNINTRKVIQTIITRTASIAVTPDSKLAFTASGNGKIKVWKLFTN